MQDSFKKNINNDFMSHLLAIIGPIIKKLVQDCVLILLGTQLCRFLTKRLHKLIGISHIFQVYHQPVSLFGANPNLLLWKMNSPLIEILLHPKSGVVFSKLLFDFLALIPVLYVLKNIVVPVIRNYRLAVSLDQACGSEPRHWFYGHLERVSTKHLAFD